MEDNGKTPIRGITVAHLITGLELGGAEWMLTRLVSRMDRARYNSIVISMIGAGKLGPRLMAEGIQLVSLGLRPGVVDPFAILRLARVLRVCGPHILQSWLYHADLLGTIVRILGYSPSLVWNIRCSESVHAGLVRLACRSASAVPDAIVVNSFAGKRFHEGLGYRPKRWQYIPNGVDVCELRPNDIARERLRAELNIQRDVITIGLAARYHAMKDHATFLAAAGILARRREDVIFVLAGSGIGSDNRELIDAIGARGLAGRVRLLGERTDMSLVYPALDIACLSSAFGEGFPNVIAEAMSCGIPCVSTESGDSRQIIADTGLVVPCRDPEALSAAWERIIQLGGEARRFLGSKARQRIVTHYNLDAVVSRYEALYNEIGATVIDRPSDRAGFNPSLSA